MFGKKKAESPKTIRPIDCGVKMHGSVTVGTKGQIVIPKDVRDMLDIKEGDILMTMTKYGKFVGFIKAEDMEEFINLLRAECNN